MEYVKDIEQKEIIIFHLDIQKDKKDVVMLLYCITQFIAIHKCIWFGILINKPGIRGI